MNKKLQLQIRNAACDDCALHRGAETICQIGDGPEDARIVVVGKLPDSPKYQDMVAELLAEVGIDRSEVYWTGAVKCRNFDRSPSRGDVKACTPYLVKELELIRPEWVLALGNEALQATTGHSGITKYRGQVIEKHGTKVIPTISPAAVLRNPGQRQGFSADLAFFASQVQGRADDNDVPKMFIANTTAKVKKLKRVLARARVLSYDVETTGFQEFAEGAAIVTLAGTCEMQDGKVIPWSLPLHHPESDWDRQWQKVLSFLAPALVMPEVRIAHNSKFDDRWLQQFGVEMDATFDTMLAAHVINENRSKGLKPLAQSILGVRAWAISTKDLRADPLRDVLKYNMLDTYYTYKLYKVFRQQLIEDEKALRIFKLLLMPANRVLTRTERRGVWVDRERLHTRLKIGFERLADIEDKLMQWVPDQDSTDWPTNARGKPVPVNFNASNFARWWLFEYLGLPVTARGKPKDDGSPGAPSMSEDVLLALRDAHPVIPLMLDRAVQNKLCTAFLSPYSEQVTEDDRIHTTFKLHGTVTGRLSSGKQDEEKVTSKAQIRGVNFQQVPRDKFVRGLFGAPPGWLFVEADFSQAELRIAAMLSGDRTMIHLYQTGQDIHRATAAWVLGIPPDKVGPVDRKKAKAVNFGFLYGMGWRKFIHTAFTKYELHFTEDEAQNIRTLFFEQFRGLQPWHAKQRRLVHKYKRVVSPLGRVRHLPDIDSPDKGVQHEAERQAINSPVQSFASDLNLLSMILLDQRFGQAPIHTLGTVHDAILFEVREDFVDQALPLIKNTMENLPTREKFGYAMQVPMVADLKVGHHWGDAVELTEDQVYNWDPSLIEDPF